MTNAEKLKRWRSANPAKAKAQRQRNYAKHQDARRQYAVEYQANRRASDPAGARAYARTLYASTMTPEKRAAENLRLRRYQNPTKKREWSLVKKYDLTIAQWEALLASQGYVCGCCGVAVPGSALGWSTDHRPGSRPVEVRGILCLGCNTAIGRLGDEKGLERALAYTRRSSSTSFGVSEGLLF